MLETPKRMREWGRIRSAINKNNDYNNDSNKVTIRATQIVIIMIVIILIILILLIVITTVTTTMNMMTILTISNNNDQ